MWITYTPKLMGSPTGIESSRYTLKLGYCWFSFSDLIRHTPLSRLGSDSQHQLGATDNPKIALILINVSRCFLKFGFHMVLPCWFAMSKSNKKDKEQYFCMLSPLYPQCSWYPHIFSYFSLMSYPIIAINPSTWLWSSKWQSSTKAAANQMPRDVETGSKRATKTWATGGSWLVRCFFFRAFWTQKTWTKNKHGTYLFSILWGAIFDHIQSDVCAYHIIYAKKNIL